jgi:hypothetical protein
VNLCVHGRGRLNLNEHPGDLREYDHSSLKSRINASWFDRWQGSIIPVATFCSNVKPKRHWSCHAVGKKTYRPVELWGKTLIGAGNLKGQRKCSDQEWDWKPGETGPSYPNAVQWHLLSGLFHWHFMGFVHDSEISPRFLSAQFWGHKSRLTIPNRNRGSWLGLNQSH